MRNFSAIAVLGLITFASACSDSSTAPANLIVKSGDNQSALAGTSVGAPIVISGVGDQSPTFSVIAGGGTLSSTTGTVNSDGTVTAPTWTLGKSAVPQQLQATLGSKTVVVTANVQTAYKLEVRFFGRTLTAQQQAFFTNAANRIRAIVVGAVPLVNVDGIDVAKDCGATGVAPLTGNIDGLVIWASIDSIDGKNKILAQSGPCYFRDANDFRTVIGIMKFDSADVGALGATSGLQQVITHEMLHVVGFGTFWDSTAANLLSNYGPDVRYDGPGGIEGCKEIGGASTCATSVPVEGTEGGEGTVNSHWRESTFGNELMTGFFSGGTNPLSKMTIESLGDLNYTVNPAGADLYPDPNTQVLISLRSGLDGAGMSATPPSVWERALPRAPRPLPKARSVHPNTSPK